MFSSALKSLSSNITSNYAIAPQASSTAGPWKIFDAKRKQTGKVVSVFVFDKKSLEPTSGGSSLGGTRSNGGLSLKRAHEEVLERLKREASSLAKLRHPSILELVEPVEDTRYGGLMFATEQVTASLASLLRAKDEQERAGAAGGRGSRYVVEEQDGTRRRREVEIDELEIQKGLLQLGRGLDFLHNSAGLVHGNLTPEAVLVNAKGDWKIAGLAFCGPHENSTAATSLAPISLHELLNHDPRLPRIVQLDLDYTSPDFVLDNTLTASADMFSLGLLIISLYNSPHNSPLQTGGSLSAYKRVFSSASSIPTKSNNFLVPAAGHLPPKMKSEVLPRLITRRPAQRLTAKEFQEAPYFDNILVSTIRFLESLPTKTHTEKSQFLRGLPKIMPQFPNSVLEKKLLPTLLEEMKDPNLLSPIITNIFAMLTSHPAVKHAFASFVLPRLHEIFVASRGAERDATKDAGLVVFLENLGTAAQNCTGKEFRDHILPIILVALENATLSIVDTALSTLPHVLSALDFSTIKNEVFPAVAAVFAKTSSLSIKIRGLEAFYILCGGSLGSSDQDGIDGFGFATDNKAAKTSSTILDKFTIQEKIVPLLKAIKTKEPGVMVATLRVFRQISGIVDTDFLAVEVIPVLWQMSIGPLLDLQQFQSFMKSINEIGGRIEREQTRKLTELAGTGRPISNGFAAQHGMSSGGSLTPTPALHANEEVEFEALVSGRQESTIAGIDLINDWGSKPPATSPTVQPSFAWATPRKPSQSQPSAGAARMSTVAAGVGRTITPDQSMATFGVLQPTSTQYGQPLQPSLSKQQPLSSVTTMNTYPLQSNGLNTTSNSNTSVDWSAAAKGQQTSMGPRLSNTGNTGGAFSIPPPPSSSSTSQNAMRLNFPTQQSTVQWQAQHPAPSQKTGLDKYESLI